MSIQKALEDLTEVIKVTSGVSWYNEPLFTITIASLLAACLSFIIQQLFKKRDDLKSIIIETYKYNEAVVYHACTLETVLTHIRELVLPNFKNEESVCGALHQGERPKAIRTVTIRPLEIANTDLFTAKILDIGKYPEMARVFIHMREEMLQFKKHCR